MFCTVETRLNLDVTQESTIDSCVYSWSIGYRKTWVSWNNKHLSEVEIYHQLKELNWFTTEQIGSLINKVKTEHSKIKELTKVQLKASQSKLDNIHKFIAKEAKLVTSKLKNIDKLKTAKTIDYSKIAKLNNSVIKKQFTINSKKLKIDHLNKFITTLQNRIEKNTFKLCFGSSKLLSQRPDNHKDKFRLNEKQTVYSDVHSWTNDWKLARDNIWMSIGKKTKPQGNSEIQYYPQSKILRLRVTEKEYLNRLAKIANEINLPLEDLNDNKKIKNGLYRMQARFIEITNVEFCLKNQTKLTNSIHNKQPITAKIIKKLTPNSKDIGFYLQLSFEEIVMPLVVLEAKPKTMGVDLNQKGLAYCVVKADGNKLNDSKIKSYGFIPWSLEKKTTEQREYLISNAIRQVLDIAQSFGVYSVAIENLDFSSTINHMNSGYKSNEKYNHMLTQFAKTQFQSLIMRKIERLGMTLSLVNPVYSSIGGYVKYGLLNKLPVDIAASLWLARQSIFGLQFKQEDNVRYTKKYNEEISFPYHKQPKQSKRLFAGELKWGEISLALGKNRKIWYHNLLTSSPP